MTTVIERLKTIVDVTEGRRAAGHPMTYQAGQALLEHASDLVRLADVVGDFLAGDATKAAVVEAYQPLLATRTGATP